MLSSSLGATLSTTRPPAGRRRFCFSSKRRGAADTELAPTTFDGCHDALTAGTSGCTAPQPPPHQQSRFRLFRSGKGGPLHLDEDEDAATAVSSSTDADAVPSSSALLGSVSEELQGLEVSLDFSRSDPTETDANVDELLPGNAFRTFVLATLGLQGHGPAAIKPAASASISSSPWRKTALLLASKAQLLAAIHLDYSEVLLGQASVGVGAPSSLEMHLAAADHILGEFVELQTSVLRNAQRIHLCESLVETLLGAVDEYVRPRITDHYTPTLLPSVTPGEAARVVAWIHHWQEILEHRTPYPTMLDPEWHRDRQLLLELYVERAVRRELREMRAQLSVPQLMAAEDDVVRRNPEGQLVSTTPEQVTFMVDSQLSVALDCLPEVYLEHVLEACNQELSLLVGDWMLSIGTLWKDMPSHWFCVLINDSTRLAELCEERNAAYLTSDGPYKADAEAVVREFSELSLHATVFLCERIFVHLRDPAQPILTAVGTDAWAEDATQSALERTIATLKDYFSDLETWLGSGYFYPKVLKNCFDMMLHMYVESFFANTLARGVKDPERVAEELNEDYLRLVIFFNSDRFANFHGTNPSASQQFVNSRLHVIRCLSKLVDPKVSADEATGEVRFLMSELKAEKNDLSTATSAVFHLVGLRSRLGGIERIEWLRLVSKTKRALERETATQKCGCGPYRLPDLRNSKFLQNVRPKRNEMHRRLSTESMALVRSTGKLLQVKAQPSTKR